MAVPTRVQEIDQRMVELLLQRVELLRGEVAPGAVPPVDWGRGVGEVDAESAEALGISGEALRLWLRHAASLSASASAVRAPIVYLGPLYSYSYLAAVKHFGLASHLVPVATIAAAFEEILRNQATYGVVPIENSTDGRVVDTLGMFARGPVRISGEILLPIHHCLLARRGRAEIREVRSKPQALSQCRNWLAQHLPEAELVEVASTAIAAAAAAENPSVAAIASAEAGLHHDLPVIDENIEDNRENVTRFAIIGGEPRAPTGDDKTSLMFQLKHQPGALADAMVAFQKSSVNLTWIESFPLPDSPKQYLFFVELDGHRVEPPVAAAITELERLALRLEVLGSYPRGV